MIGYLHTNTFRKLGDCTIHFEDGSNIICGENGVGKSTIFRAIRFALYGVGAAGCSKDLLPTYGHKTCRVTLGLDDLKIVRTLNNCTITKNEKLEAEGNTACTAYVENYLGMDFKAFNIFCLSPQGETQALLTIGATELNRRVEQYAGVELIDKVIKKASSDQILLKGRLNGRTIIDLAPLTEQQTETTTLLQSVSSDLHTIKSRIMVINEEVGELNDYLRTARQHNQATDQAKELYLQAQRERDASELDLTDAELELSALINDKPNLEHIRMRLSEAEEELVCEKELCAKTVGIDQQIARAESAITELRVKAALEAESQAELVRLGPVIKEVSGNRDHQIELVSVLENSLKQNRRLLKEGVCPTCHRAYDGFNEAELRQRMTKDKQVLELEKQELTDLEQNYKLLLSQEKHLLSKVGNYQELLSEESIKLDRWIAKRNELPTVDLKKINRLEKLRTELQVLLKHGREHESQLNRAQAQVDRLQRAFERNSQTMQTNAALAHRERMLTVDQKELLAEYETEYNELHRKELSLGGAKVGHEADLQHINDELKHAHENNQDVAALTRKMDDVTALLKLLRNHRQSFMGEIWDSVLLHSSRFVRDATGGWVSEIGRDAKGNFTFREEGKAPAPVNGAASGAQAAFCGSAIRVGIAQALHGKQALMMLDEPTESMSERNASKLASGLLSLGGQSLLITHRKSEAVSAQNIIEL